MLLWMEGACTVDTRNVVMRNEAGYSIATNSARPEHAMPGLRFFMIKSRPLLVKKYNFVDQ